MPQVPQGSTQAMQFAPWQATFGPTGLPQGLAWAPGAIQSSALLAQGSQIFIRNPQHEQTGMFIQNTQPSSIPQHNRTSLLFRFLLQNLSGLDSNLNFDSFFDF